MGDHRPTVRERLVSILDEHSSAGTLVGNNTVNGRGAISRHHYADLLGVSPGSIHRLRTVLRTYELAYVGNYVRSDVPIRTKWGAKSADELTALLNSDMKAGCLVAHRSQKLSRAHYARKLGVWPSRDLYRVLSEFESIHPMNTGITRHIEGMRRWLKSAYDNGSLMLKDGRVDRKACLAAFGGFSSTPARNSAVRRLFEEFDEQARAEGYLPKLWLKEQSDLQAALEITPPDIRNGLKVNVAAVCRACGIDVQRLRLPHLACLIGVHQKLFDEQVASSELIFIANGRLYGFEYLVQYFGNTFAVRLAKSFKSLATRLLNAKDVHGALSEFLTWLVNHPSKEIQLLVFEARATGRINSAELWEDAAYDYRRHLIEVAVSTRSSARTAGIKLNHLRRALTALASSGPLPVINVIGVRDRREKRKKPSIIEPKLGAGEKEYLSFAHSLLQSSGKEFAVEVSSDETGRLVNYLAVEAAGYKKFSVPMAMLNAIRIVLAEIKSRARKCIGEAMVEFRQASRLLPMANIDSREFLQIFLQSSLNRVQDAAYLQRYFPARSCEGSSGAELSDLGVANLLRLLIDLCGGLCPSKRGPEPYARFLAHRIKEAGGKKRVERLLGPDAHTVSAIITLYLCETGANVGVGRTLPVNCIEQSELADHRRVTGTKARAKGKPIVVDLPAESFVFTAMNWLVGAGSRYRSRAGDDSDRLFVTKQRNVTVITEFSFRESFRTLTAGIIDGVALVPDMIRPTVLLRAALENDGRLQVGIALAQHGEAVSQGYQQKWPVKLIYDQNIRKFQEQFETIILSGIDEAASKLGTTSVELSGRLSGISPTGLGTFCRGGNTTKIDISGSCMKLDCWNACPSMLLVAEKHSIASLQLWQDSLRKAQGDWERDHIERWEQVWLPWLCLADVVEEKMVRGPLVSVWQDARAIAAARLRDPAYLPPRPF